MASLVWALLPLSAGISAEYNYYKGKTLTMLIPHAPGGGFDTYARTIMPYLEEEMGVKITPKQAKGGGGIRETNLVWAAKPDGMTFAINQYSLVGSLAAFRSRRCAI